MDKHEQIILISTVPLVLVTAMTYVQEWYWFNLSNAIIIAALFYVLYFIVTTIFLKRFLMYAYLIKLTNVISLIWCLLEYDLEYINYSKPIMDIVLYIWLVFVIVKYRKGWRSYFERTC